ncbi:DUF1540 domain-containing protein [Alicyclobacillus tolerans]|uniref:DUF1540 domain-containing protein n=2 Tax=Alicyclobacillus tolerans TaxID=90970 RepID=A0ABT9LWP0_9BACL|nr:MULTISPECIES: DUF1540 domain-containing protein [Alicyclobacillus]MDP9728692.1 hypothetical protein [Alicyclobacillus tengchongensis]QRF23285.1 DUF1540 domain-containing protein [Alicyclobacillus sp. TC]SHK41529.1 protein of unknown function [Alicyclobacillus montanus]
MPNHVKCAVEECLYNQNSACSAEEIEIRTNGNPIVGTSKGTMCETFIYKDYRGHGRDAYHAHQESQHS